MSFRISKAGLQIAPEIYDLIEQRILPGAGISSQHFWSSLAAIIHDLTPRIRQLLKRRDELQASIDRWHRDRAGTAFDLPGYRTFLREIGYLQPEGPDFQITTSNVDPEISLIAGPQLVVPVMNARYALNAANARWGSLYDALYGTDVIPEAEGCQRGPAYNPNRGAKVISFVRDFLDQCFSLAKGNEAQAVA